MMYPDKYDIFPFVSERVDSMNDDWMVPNDYFIFLNRSLRYLPGIWAANRNMNVRTRIAISEHFPQPGQEDVDFRIEKFEKQKSGGIL